jgi:hypothetical protein
MMIAVLLISPLTVAQSIMLHSNQTWGKCVARSTHYAEIIKYEMLVMCLLHV